MSEPEDTMNEPEDRAIASRFAALEPSDARLSRMEDAVLDAFDAAHRSLGAEWLDLVRVRPVTNGALTLAAAAALLMVTPIGWMLLALLRG